MRILLVEDDPVLAEALMCVLRIANYAVDRVSNGLAADEALKGNVFDLLILDLGLPKLDGFEVLKRLRARVSAVPVLIVSGRARPEEKVRGLDLGADDYIVKPFSIKEFEARVRALLRRGQCGSATQINRAGVCFDTVTRTAMIGERQLALSSRETNIFEVLLHHFGRVVSKQQLVERLYSYDETANQNTIEVYVHRLRKKLEPTGMMVRTFHGHGYQLDRRNPA